jgi:hypothetical protein
MNDKVYCAIYMNVMYKYIVEGGYILYEGNTNICLLSLRNTRHRTQS